MERMDISMEHVKNIGAFVTALISQMATLRSTRRSTAFATMKLADPRLGDDELLRRVARHHAAMRLVGAPGHGEEATS